MADYTHQCIDCGQQFTSIVDPCSATGCTGTVIEIARHNPTPTERYLKSIALSAVVIADLNWRNSDLKGRTKETHIANIRLADNLANDIETATHEERDDE